MQPARSFEDSGPSAQGREADTTTSRPTPLTLVAGVCPPGSIDAGVAAAIAAHAAAVVVDDGVGPGVGIGSVPDAVAEAVPVQIANRVVGIVAAVNGHSDRGPGAAERRAWLEAAAAASSVTALIREGHGAGDADGALLGELAAGQPDDLSTFLARARRLGVELAGGAIALCADGPPGGVEALVGELRGGRTALAAVRASGRLVALVALGADGDDEPARRLAARLRDDGWAPALSAPRRDPALLHQAVLEAELLAQLRAEDAVPAGQDGTYRLLIGVLLRDRDELQQLRHQTISPLAAYDARHDTDLLATLTAFLDHDGSTTETADAMQLHRHTVGYRLSRVYEVSGLSPYASDGRERLSLGIKAHRILAADERRGSPPA